MHRILVVDDAKLVRDVLCRFLAAAGYEVLEAEDGAKAAAAYRAAPADLVICDLVMPEMDGLETLRELRRIDPQARVIMISGGIPENTAESVRAASELGALAFLAKPFARKRLLEVVASALEG